MTAGTVDHAGDVRATARLLPGAGERPDLGAHLRRHGPLPAHTAELIEQVERSGLTGRGGAGFPLARKLRVIAAGRRAVVVANGAEGEPASCKDRALLTRAPHLVLDGLQAAAGAVGARRAVAYVHADAVPAVRRAVAERVAAGLDRVAVEVVPAPPGFVSGQETAVVRAVDGGPALPRSSPPRVFEQGVGGRPTLVSNVETLAHLALVDRNGADWFRGAGTPTEPGTMLCTVSGSSGGPVVVEVPLGASLPEVLIAGGRPAEGVAAVLVGGYHGAWLPGPPAAGLTLSAAHLAPVGAVPGAGVLLTLEHGTCPLTVTAGIVRYLADSSARQCGPCLNGLPALADTLATLADTRATLAGRSSPTMAPARLEQLARLVTGRGACAHPDGTGRLVRSLLTAFPAELDAHVRGTCSAATLTAARR